MMKLKLPSKLQGTGVGRRLRLRGFRLTYWKQSTVPWRLSAADHLGNSAKRSMKHQLSAHPAEAGSEVLCDSRWRFKQVFKASKGSCLRTTIAVLRGAITSVHVLLRAQWDYSCRPSARAVTSTFAYCKHRAYSTMFMQAVGSYARRSKLRATSVLGSPNGKRFTTPPASDCGSRGPMNIRACSSFVWGAAALLRRGTVSALLSN
ncbi:hypothetical protein BDV96DRAFT_135729 [Lophiotrema nucula]|uniref:Uncharacterized protein n=1 Tax=Lophiotrema nucula TaxID=690887 RepID=A0A6A5ZSD5_9PLEO|nr:hypothetical protein BDV96DRAFT_135729 [Lophiotrema nucula]